MKNDILENYNIDVLSNKIIKDESQIKIISVFQFFYDELCKKKSFKDKIFQFFIDKSHLKFGVYLWGDVGRGKTYLINLFFDTLPFKNKIRLHFHSFMYKIHNELSVLSGYSDPLEYVAKQLF